MTGYVMKDKERFREIGLLPDRLPPFLNGYQRWAELWLYEQPSDYYRRHLLLHEGTHAFMNWALGGTGPPWYVEGMAELLATHRWQEGQLTLGYFPHDKAETPEWGRIKIIRADLAARRGKSLEQIMQYDEKAHLQVEPYAWCWAAAAFFDGQPAYRPRFRELRRYLTGSGDELSAQFMRSLESEWPYVARQWQVFIFNLDYGYQLEREAIERSRRRRCPPREPRFGSLSTGGGSPADCCSRRTGGIASRPRGATSSPRSRAPGGANPTG